MLTILLASLALGGDLVVQATVPAQIHVDGQLVAQLFTESELRVPVQVGSHQVTVYRNGNPEPLEVRVIDGLDTTLVVGRTGTTTGQALERIAPIDGTLQVEFRVGDGEGVLLILDGERHELEPGEVFTTEVQAGDTPMSVRSASGTVVWASGKLALTSGPVVVQLTSGRVPEVPSLGGSFYPSLR